MIAILAAVPLETALLRREIVDPEEGRCGAWPLLRGRLAGLDVALLHCGVGKVNAAAAAALMLELLRPEMVLVTGCGGAYLGSGLAVGDLALASAEILADEGAMTPDGFLDMERLGFPLFKEGEARIFNRIPSENPALEDQEGLLSRFATEQGIAFAFAPFATVSTCSGTYRLGEELARRTDAVCENMEGAAVALLCRRYGVPWSEVRGISNLVEDREPERWDIGLAAEIAQKGVLQLLRHLSEGIRT